MLHHIHQILNTVFQWVLDRLNGEATNVYERHRRGQNAEETVARRLRRAGYRILDRNFECKNGEIDIIAFHDGTVIFVEVRSVTDPALVDPISSIDAKKRKRIIRAAQRYATLNNLRDENVILRFDAIGVHYDRAGTILEMEHIVDAFRA